MQYAWTYTLRGMQDPRQCLTTLTMWTRRHWLVAALGGIGTGLLVAVSTALIPTPIFGRAIEPEWWAWPVVIVTSILGGLLIGTYVRDPRFDPVSESGPTGEEDSLDKPSKLALTGGVLAWFAVGCPVCNKIVLLALGASGAVAWFAPVQPFLALASVGLLFWALRTRLINAGSCALPARSVDA